jgi:transposase
MLERISLSVDGIKRLEVLTQLCAGKLSQRVAAQVLGVTERHVRRLHKSYEARGASALVSGHCGKQSNNRIDETLKQAILARIVDAYPDFGPTLASEYLRKEGFRVSKETLRVWLIEAGIWKVRKVRRKRIHLPRARRPRVGELVQIDGSAHDWFEGRAPRCSLIAFIDDASSRVMYARFFPVESLRGYLQALQSYVSAYGCPVALYSDRHSIFSKHNPEDAEPTQFQRAIASLGITGILALTPQAKGRVERLFQTLQDRLVKAMRLERIRDMEQANAFLPTYLLEHNARFCVCATDPKDAHIAYCGDASELARICAIHNKRKLSKDLVVSYNRQRYVVQTGGTPRYALRGQSVIVISYADQRVELLYANEILPFTVFDTHQPPLLPLDEKQINICVDEIVKKRQYTEKYKPAPNHPWRNHSKPALADTDSARRT